MLSCRNLPRAYWRREFCGRCKKVWYLRSFIRSLIYVWCYDLRLGRTVSNKLSSSKYAFWSNGCEYLLLSTIDGCASLFKHTISWHSFNMPRLLSGTWLTVRGLSLRWMPQRALNTFAPNRRNLAGNGFLPLGDRDTAQQPCTTLQWESCVGNTLDGKCFF